jgi:N6-L-threonylcarbamoyladenine synthase
MIEELLGSCGVNYSDLTEIVSTVGPGSFTGIRVGLAAARALCMASATPGAGYSTLETIAYGASLLSPGRPVLSVLNAGKQEVYFQAFSATPQWHALSLPAVGTPERALEHCPPSGLVAANLPLGRPSDSPVTFPRADLLAQLAARGHGEPCGMSPLYIRPPDAKPMKVDR